MSEEVERTALNGYISMKQAARMLGLTYGTVRVYVNRGRIKSVQIGGAIAISLEEVARFKRKGGGRPRTKIPQWRIPTEEDFLFHILIHVQIRPGQRDELNRRLEQIRSEHEHEFPGTIDRYILGESDNAEVDILLIWRSSVMPDEETRQASLAVFREDLADVLDWDTAKYKEGTVMMHARG